MQIRISTKLMIGVAMLVLVLFSAVAYLFINEKKTELAEDIYVNSLAFSRLTSSTIIDYYDLYLAQNSFVYFNTEIQSIFEQNEDINRIEVISYTGNVLYDSDIDTDKRYVGAPRLISDEDLMKQVKSRNISIKTMEDRVVYFKPNMDGKDFAVDFNETHVDPPKTGTLLEYIVVPESEKYSLVYYLDYTNLNNRIAAMVKRIVYLALFGIILGILLAYFMAKNLTRPVSKLVDGVDEISRGNFAARVKIKTSDELSFLGNAFNKMAKDLAASIDAKVYKERVTHELELATRIQNQIVPDEIPFVNGLDIDADLLPASEIGGDMYDFISMGDDEILFYLGDVTGHGVPAGIVSSIANSLFFGFSYVEDLKDIITRVNRVFRAKTMTNMFMTLCLLRWDSKTDLLSYVSAGHEQLLHYKASDGTVKLVPAGGIALGMVDDVNKLIKVENMSMEKGDFVVLYSDGIPEAWKNDKETYGIERFMKSLQKNASLSSQVSSRLLKNALLADLKNFMGGYKQMDDITMVVVKKL
ncbi:SpoIIE family protein phosphatase [Candidatus Peregrinibacteria bacterium]|nr:SpoIIE family protein phosphatase [Candidatus Peregrinibacteria bacterium]